MSVKKRDMAREKRDYRSSMDSAMKLYNSSLNQLTSATCHKSPNNDELAKIRDSLRAVLVGDDTMVIIQSGPFIWKYREQISKKEESFFLENTFNDDIEIAKEKLGNLDKSKDFSDLEIATIMDSIKSIYTNMSSPEKETIWRFVMDLLRAYAQYVGAERKLNQVEVEIRDLIKK